MKIFYIILRWTFLLPLAILSSVISYTAIKFLNRISWAFVGYDPDFILSTILIEFLSHTGMGSVFIYVGVRLAPAQKIKTTYALAIFGYLGISGISYFSFIQGNYWHMLYSLFFITGVTAKAYDLLENLNVEREITIVSF